MALSSSLPPLQSRWCWEVSMPPRQSRMVDILLRRDPVWVNELLSPVSSGTVTLTGDEHSLLLASVSTNDENNLTRS